MILLLLPNATVKLLQLTSNDGRGLHCTELIDTGLDAEKWHCLMHVGNVAMKQVTDVLLFVISRIRYGCGDFLQCLYICTKQIISIKARMA